MNEQLVFELSVDTVDLVKGLATAKNGLDQFAEVGKTSIAQLNAALKALEAQAGKSVNPAEIEKLKGSYAEVKAEVARFRKEFRELKKDSDDVGNSIATTGSKSKKAAKDLEELDPVAKRSRIAVYGLNQVVRDLPFGFIAISNNIPVLFDQLNALRQETGSNRAAFKAFYDGLVGAGGVTIGLSILVSSVTAAVQKYGSLRGAVDAFLITNGDLVLSLTDATKKLRDYTKELKTAQQIQQRTDLEANAQAVQAQGYADAIFDLTKSERERGNALKRLQALDKDVFGSLDLQKTGVIELTAAVDTYLAKIGQTKKIDAYQKQVDLTTTTLADQKDILNALGAEITALEKKQASGTLQYATSSPIVQSYGLELDILRAKYKTTQQAIDQLNVKLKDQKQAVKEVTIENTKFDTGLEETTNATDAQKKAIDKEIAGLIKKKDEYQESLKSLSLLGQEYLQVEIAIAKIDAAIKKLKTDSLAEKLQIDIDLGKTIEKLIAGANARVKESRGIDFTPLFQTTGNEFEKRTTEIFNPAQVNRFSEALKTAGQVFGNIKIIPSETVEKSIAEVQKIREEAFQTAKAFMEVLGPAIDTVFNAIENGENVFQAISKSLKQLVVDLVKATVKAAAFALIITTITTAAGAPVPFGAAFKTGLKLQNGGGGLTGLFGGGGVAAQGGGLSVGPGGLAIQGNVTFVQRGQDLVGVLAQSNARINRVG
jgi:chromosome segregation ATPase